MVDARPLDAEVVVVGAGAAGLFAALVAARAGARVALVSAAPLARTASYWAQGGIAAALADDDSPERHLADTEAAGRGAVRRSAAEVLCREAPTRVAELERLGVHFDADREGRLALGLEGGHSVRRVVHAGGSATGRRIVRELSADAALEPQIDVLERRRATALLMAGGRCVGVAGEDDWSVRARAVVLCTGGAAALWSRTTNPPGSVGAGLLVAHAAGAELADLELLQFHPTAVVAPPRTIDGFLVTEAIRGEGARLLDASGDRFVDELAPRDEVARAIQDELDRTGAPAISLDMRDVDRARFPNVVEALRRIDIDPGRDLVPVAPAAHYSVGGIATDLAGRSAVPGLLAVGECACTGLHGANRLASNSLAECVVFGRRAALAALDEPAPARGGEDPRPVAPPQPVRPEWSSRRALWHHAGLERDADGLRLLADDPHPLVRLIATGALARTESRGVHFRTDRPAPDPEFEARHAVVGAAGDVRFERWD